MSITLKTGTSTTVELLKVKNLPNGAVLQRVGTNFQDVYSLTMTENIGKTGTAKGRASMRVPYPATATSPAGFAFVNIEFTVPAECPIAIANQIPHLASSAAISAEFAAMISQRSVNVN